MIDFPRISAASLPHAESLVSKWLPAGKRNGHEWLIGDLAGNPGKSCSINLQTGVWADFSGDDKGGDLISLYAAINRCDQAEAARAIAADLGIDAEQSAASPKRKGQEWVQVIPAPDHAPEAPLKHFHYGLPDARWCYRDAQGRVLGWIARYAKSDGGKEVMPCTWARSLQTGDETWKWLSFPKPRPLYGLDLLAKAKPDARVVIVEGEKCADALRTMGGLVMTWPGGSKAVKHTDWTPLASRKVTIWPDADKPGGKAADEIAGILHSQGCEVRLITPPDDKADGWDCADALAEGWTRDQVAALFKAAAVYEPEPPQDDAPPTMSEPPGLESLAEPETEWPFRILGQDMGTFFYLSHASRQVVELTAKGHNKVDMLQLAPLEWWTRMFPQSDKNGDGVNWMYAANALIQQSLRRVFDPTDIRGRGSWLDAGRVVYHAGDCLMVRNMPHALSSWDSEYVYQRNKAIKIQAVPAATDKEAHRLITLTSGLNLKNPIDHLLLSGWLVCAPICGVLDWRPHIWITGPSGSGKTFLIERIIRPLLGNMALYVQSNTTEAGIRQSLGCDALPVMFDEAETENQRDLARFQQVLILARQASRDSGGRIVKGTSGGIAQAFHIRSCFCFSSIGVAATQRADLSRITPLELYKRHGQDAQDQFDDLLAMLDTSAANPDWCAAIRNRAIDLAEVIGANAHVFATACTRHLGAQRDGDQIGALLAGAYALTSPTRITPEQAAAWCAKQDWTHFASQESDMDEHRAFAVLMAAIIMHDDSAGRSHRLSIAEIVAEAIDPGASGRTAAKATLERYGVGVRRDGIDIADAHQELRKVFAETPFAGKWADQLRRIDGARTVKNSHFHRVQTRATRLPLELFERRAEE
jgi:putative DNA primase/helicase